MPRGCLLQVGVVPQEITCLWTIWICASAHFSRAARFQCTEAPCNYHFGVRTTAAFPRALTPSMLSEQLSAAHKQYQWQQKVDPLFHSARSSQTWYLPGFGHHQAPDQLFFLLQISIVRAFGYIIKLRVKSIGKKGLQIQELSMWKSEENYLCSCAWSDDAKDALILGLASSSWGKASKTPVKK